MPIFNNRIMDKFVAQEDPKTQASSAEPSTTLYVKNLNEKLKQRG